MQSPDDQQMTPRPTPAGSGWRQRVVHRVIAAATTVGNLAWNFGHAIADVEVIRNVKYGAHPTAHLLDIYRPRSAQRPLPVLLYIHGGAFVICSKDTHRFLALLNAERAGYLVFSINYRLAPKHKFPAAIEDACDAYRWVVHNAARYGGDPERIIVAGESAGGNLALGVAIAATYERPEAYARRVHELNMPPVGVMPLMPYLQTSNPGRRAADPGVSILSLAVARYIARAYLEDATPGKKTLMADPIRVLEECPAPARSFPTVFTGVGTADMCCADSRRLEEACNRLGVPVQALYYEDEYHVFHAIHWRIAARAFWRECIDFMIELANQPKTNALAGSGSHRSELCPAVEARRKPPVLATRPRFSPSERPLPVCQDPAGPAKLHHFRAAAA